jgi:hypothetical protein
LIEQIQNMLFDKMPAPGIEEHPINWTDVGTIGEIERQLRELADWMCGVN